MLSLTSTDFRGLVNRRFFQNFVPLPATLRFRLHQRTPDFQLPAIGEGNVRLSAYRGQAPVVLLFTRIFTEKQYCPFCYPHLLAMIRAYDRFIGLGAQVLMVTSTDQRQSEVVKRDLGLPMPLLSDPGCQTFRAYGTGQALGAPLPAQFVLDADGRLRFQHLFSFLHPNASPERLLWILGNLEAFQGNGEGGIRTLDEVYTP